MSPSSPEALENLRRLYDWITDAASPAVALCLRRPDRDVLPGHGLRPGARHRRDEIRPGLRIVGFERRITVAFTISAERVTILRLFYGGRDWEALIE